jgi:hypothetical protein
MKHWMGQKLTAFRADQTGSVMAFWAMTLAVFIGLVALSVDFGRMAATQSELQSYADNVALAAAGELNGLSGSITRATLAAQTFIIDTQTFGDGDVILSNEGDYQLAFFSSPPTPTSSGIATTDPYFAGYIQVTATQQNVSAVFGAAFAALTDQGSGEGLVNATAVAGFTQYACDITPLMFCAPSIDFRADDNIGNSILLRSGGQNASWLPGAFGFANPAGSVEVDEDGVCAGLSGAKQDICLISAVGNRTSCFAQSGIDIAGGQRVGNFEVALNVRFDIYHAGTNQLRNDPNYPPAPNVLSSWEPASGQCIGNTGVLALAKIGLPADDCYDAGSCSRFGDGDWSQGRESYVDINYGGVDPFPSAVTRYDYYLAEIEASAGGSGGLLGSLINDILPQCSNNTSSDPARRVVVAASIDCLNLTMSNGHSDVKVIEFVELFLTAPIGLDGSKDIWVEIVAGVGGGSGGSDDEARFREVVQLYR